MSSSFLLLTLALAGALRGQDGACDSPAALSSVPQFVECARSGTARYRDREVAIRDGYRRIGRDFPAMGEHWIRVALVFDGKFDASRPEVLNYVEIDGEPRLFGVGYAVPLLSGETAPPGPAGLHAWHDHFRTIDDETLLPHHHTHGSANDGARLAMMHAWIWSGNPHGIFAADNWAIPFERRGLGVPAGFPEAAAKALSLASGGRDYVEASVEAAGADGGHERAAVKQALDRAVERVIVLLPPGRRTALDWSELGRLAGIWTEMWAAIDEAVPPRVRKSLASLAVR